MIMADVLTWFLIIAGTYLVLVCYWLASAALFPQVVEGCRHRYGRHPLVATLVGEYFTGIIRPHNKSTKAIVFPRPGKIKCKNDILPFLGDGDTVGYQEAIRQPVVIWGSKTAILCYTDALIY